MSSNESTESEVGEVTRQRVSVAVLGPDGSYTQIAAEQYLALSAKTPSAHGYDTFRAVAEAVEQGEVVLGVLPLENTDAGSVVEVYDILASGHLSIVGEIVVPIDHCLLALGATPITDIRFVLSNPQALMQCSEFLSTLERCLGVAASSTASAARKVVEDGDPRQAAIASESAAARYGLTVIRRGISNRPGNATRFVVLARDPDRVPEGTSAKTSIIIATPHECGALGACLDVLSRHGLNLTKIESRPRRDVPWEYLFHLDFEGNLADPEVDAALRELVPCTTMLRVLGSYRSAVRASV